MRALLLLAILLLSACLDTSSPPASGASASAAAEPSAGVETGSLVVRVTTSELQPVEGAQVSLAKTEYAGFTDAEGKMTFNDLVPTRYTVLVAKPGYKSAFEKGLIVDVVVGEVAEAKMTLEPEVLIDAEAAYHKSLVFNGLIACSMSGAPGTVGYTSYCSRGVTVAGNEIRDPNENSTHPWEVDSIQIQSIIIQAKWQSSSGLNTKDLHMGVFRSYSCTDPGNLGQARTCNPSGDILSVSGPSPLYAAKHEATGNLTKALGLTPDKYPSKVFTAARAHCGTGCTGAAFYFQQRYEAWASSFYGAEAPAGWSVYPS